jgi:hypothetical protein
VKLALILGMFPKPFKPCVLSSIRVPPCHLYASSIVSRMISVLPSQIQQEIEFIRPMVEERFAKMDEYGEDWDDKPVCQTITSGILVITPLIHRTIC